MNRYLPLEERFWGKVNKTGACWLWTGVFDNGGYGIIKVNKRKVGAHRVSWELNRGPIPYGLDIDHLCRVRSCVNPDHLEPVTRKENIERGVARITSLSRFAAMTHCRRGHEFTPENTRHSISAKGYTLRTCKTCQQAWNSRNYRASRGRTVEISET
jgi:HNH endonuclease